MKNYGLKLSVFLLLVLALGFVSISRSTADIKADEVIRTPDGQLYYIAFGDSEGYIARPVKSLAALKSYKFLSDTPIKLADLTSDQILAGYPLGFRDGTVACSTQTTGSDIAGECSMIFNNTKHPFGSEKVFLDAGYNYDTALFLDTSTLPRGSAITLVQQTRRPGTLINDAGTIKLITSSYTTAGVPSLAVLQSWGWQPADAVPATSADKLLIQTDILSTREAGQADIELITDNEVAESIVMLYTIGKYPDQPRNKAVNQDAKTEVVEFHKSLSNLSTADLRPYLTEHSQKLYDSLPSFISASMTTSLPDTVDRNSEAIILGDGNYAHVKQLVVQQGTNYSNQITIAYKKESGVWKVDLAESLKLELQDLINDIPNNELGSTDLSITSAKVEPSDGSGTNHLLVQIKNNGPIEATNYSLFVSTDNTSLVKNGFTTSYYNLKPGQSIKLRIPLIHLEQLGLPSGSYPISLLLIPSQEETNPNNNITDFTSQLNQSFAAKVQ